MSNNNLTRGNARYGPNSDPNDLSHWEIDMTGIIQFSASLKDNETLEFFTFSGERYWGGSEWKAAPIFHYGRQHNGGRGHNADFVSYYQQKVGRGF